MPFSEKKLAAGLGLTRDDFSHARKTLSLKADADFVFVGREIGLTETGLAQMLEYWRATGLLVPVTKEQLRAAWIGPIPAPEEAPPAGDREPVALRVTKVLSNYHLLEARFDVQPPDARRVRVTVKTNKNFVPAMKITARPKAPGSTSYELVGRCPRRKGRF